MNVAKLTLDQSLFISNGGVRKVYQHPHHDDRCIKITFNHLRNRSVRREVIYMTLYHLWKKPFHHLPRFHGFCRTNLGRGAIFDLFRDFDGKISSSLADHLQGAPDNVLTPEEIVTLLNELLDYLLQYNIIACDPAPGNLLVHYPAPKTPRLVLIDGIGNPHFVKIADISSHYAHKLIKKKWRKYVENHPILQDTFTLGRYMRRT